MTKRYFDRDHGFGDIIAVDGDKVLVRFDASPWYPLWMLARA